MIVLTREEAESILGPSPTAPNSALEPAPLKDGTYVLSDDVLDDPANADVADFLAEHLVDGNPDPSLVWVLDDVNPDQEELDAYNAVRLIWSEGGAQRAAAHAAKNA